MALHKSIEVIRLDSSQKPLMEQQNKDLRNVLLTKTSIFPVSWQLHLTQLGGGVKVDSPTAYSKPSESTQSGWANEQDALLDAK